MTVITRYLGAELPPLAVTWPLPNPNPLGLVYDLTTGWTFVMKVNTGGDAPTLHTKTGPTGFVGAAVAPNLTINPAPAEFDALDPGAYSCTVIAHETATNLDLIDTFTLRLLPVPT